MGPTAILKCRLSTVANQWQSIICTTGCIILIFRFRCVITVVILHSRQRHSRGKNVKGIFCVEDMTQRAFNLLQEIQAFGKVMPGQLLINLNFLKKILFYRF